MFCSLCPHKNTSGRFRWQHLYLCSAGSSVPHCRRAERFPRQKIPSGWQNIDPRTILQKRGSEQQLCPILVKSRLSFKLFSTPKSNPASRPSLCFLLLFLYLCLCLVKIEITLLHHLLHHLLAGVQSISPHSHKK